MIKKQGHYYTEEELQFLKDNCFGITTFELTERFNKEFGTNLEHSQIYCKKKALKLKSGVKTRFQKGQGSYPRGVGYQHRFTAEQKEFIKENIKNNNYDLADIFNIKFGTNLTARQIYGAKHRHGITGAIVGGAAQRFKTGYKKGNIPATWREIGSEVVDKNNYTRLKVKDKCGFDNIKAKHRHIWEETNGKIPKGHNVIFADGDKTNFNLENLVLISQAENARLNQNKLRTNNADLTKSGVIVAKLITAIGKRKLNK